MGVCYSSRQRWDSGHAGPRSLTTRPTTHTTIECVCVFKAPRTRHPGPRCVGDPSRVHSDQCSSRPRWERGTRAMAGPTRSLTTRNVPDPRRPDPTAVHYPLPRLATKTTAIWPAVGRVAASERSRRCASGLMRARRTARFTARTVHTESEDSNLSTHALLIRFAIRAPCGAHPAPVATRHTS